MTFHMVTYLLRWSKSSPAGKTWNLTSPEVTEKQNSVSVLTASFYGARQTSLYPVHLRLPTSLRHLQEIHMIVTILRELLMQARLLRQRGLRLLRRRGLRLLRRGGLRPVRQRGDAALKPLPPLHQRRRRGKPERSPHQRKERVRRL